MIAALLFDFNGTLMRSPTWIALELRDLPRAAFAHLAEKGIISLRDEAQLVEAEAVFRAQRSAAESSDRETSHVEDLTEMIATLGLEAQVPSSLIRETVADLHRRCLPSVKLMPHVAESLQRLRELGMRLGVVSNAAYSPFLTWTLEHFGILAAFEDIVVSADVQVRKPALAIFRIALRRMGLKASETAYVGDDFRKDVVASKQAGMRAVWYQPDGKMPPLEFGVMPDAIVAGHDELSGLVEQWLSEDIRRLPT